MNRIMQKLTALAAAAVITSAACPGIVSAADDVHLTRSNVELEVGDDISIRLAGAEGTVKWQITDTDVFRYSKGKITAVGEGTAYLYAVNGGRKYKCTVTVTESADGISADTSELSLKKGGSGKVTVNTDGKDVVVRVSNADICSLSCGVIVDNKFPLTIKAKKNGTAVVTIYNRNDKSDCFSIDVTVGGSGSAKGISVSSKGAQTAEDTDSFVDEVIRLVNEERESVGVPALEKSDSLCKSADVRAGEISVKFSHTRPDGTDCFTAVSGKGYKGENIAKGYTTPEEVMTGWMNSPGHMENILDQGFTQIGVGYDENTNCWVQVFFGP